MPWDASVTIQTENTRMDLEIGFQRPKGTIMEVSTPNKKGGYGPNTPYGLIDITNIPDRINFIDFKNILLQNYAPLHPSIVVARKDVIVVFDDLPNQAKTNLNNDFSKRTSITYGQFLASTYIKRHSRKLQDNDL
jgi:hypothetical protein